MSNERPMFVRSMYASKEALMDAKCEWLEDRVEQLEKVVARLDCLEPMWCGRMEGHLCPSCALGDPEDE